MWLEGYSWLHVLQALASICAAYVLALPLALEREVKGRMHIGMRTVPLVSVGACGYVLLSRFLYEQGIYSEEGMARTLRAVMTGIGFIGGGAIVKQARVARGLATGASVWMGGAIGAAVAHSQYEMAAVATVASVLILGLPRWLAGLRRSRERDDEPAS